MTIDIELAPRGTGFVAYIFGRSSPILRPVPGNTHPATAAWWPSRAEALAELPSLLGGPVEEVPYLTRPTKRGG